MGDKQELRRMGKHIAKMSYVASIPGSSGLL